MQGIKPAGLGGGSNLDVEGLVNDLIKAEGAPPTNRLDQKEVQIQTNISAMGSFRGALADIQGSLSPLRNAEDMRKVAASSSDDEIVSVSANKDADEGQFSVEVVQLAQAHRLTSESFKSELDPIGSGNLSFQFGKVDPQSGQFVVNDKATVKNIIINDENNSLRGIAQAINQADFGVRASIINDGVGYRLAMSSAATGEINSLRIAVNDNDTTNQDQQGLSRLAYDASPGGNMNLIETAKAQDAVVLLDGIEIASASNEVSDAIKGVTLSLQATTGKEPVQIKTAFDVQGVKDSIQGFVELYNTLIDTIQSVAGYDPETKEAGPLSGDSAIRGVAEQVRRVVGSSFNGVNEDFGSLASIGIQTQRDGKLTVNDSKLQSAIEEDMLQVSKLFARAGSTSDPLLRFVGADDKAAMGAHEVSISQLGSKGRYIGAELGHAARHVIEAADNSLVLKVDGATSSPIKITPGIYQSGAELAEELQRRINNDNVFKREGVTVSVQFVVDQFVINSNRIGSASRVDVISADASLQDVGIDPAQGLVGTDIVGRIGQRPGVGSGQQLTGEGDAKGITIEALGGKTGDRGTVAFSQGVAEQLSVLLENFLGPNGLLQSRSEGYTNRIEDINRQREQLGRRLAVSEQRLLTQFSNLDASLGKMRSTSDFLTNQLAGLPGAKKKDG